MAAVLRAHPEQSPNLVFVAGIYSTTEATLMEPRACTPPSRQHLLGGRWSCSHVELRRSPHSFRWTHGVRRWDEAGEGTDSYNSGMLLSVFLVSIAAIVSGACAGPAFIDSTVADFESGSDLAPHEVSALEDQLELDPRDVPARARLLGYYSDLARYYHQSAQQRRREHILWLIEHAPESEILGAGELEVDPFESPEGYVEGKRTWLRHIERDPGNLKLLAHAASFLWPPDRDLARQLLQRAQSQDSSNPAWAFRLGEMYLLDARDMNGRANVEMASKALVQLELAHELSDGMDREFLLWRLAKAAVAAGEHDKAREFAESMLRDPEASLDQGHRIHHGNLALGQIALADGDLAEAKERLILAAMTPGSPALDSFGPNMLLAKELLEQGETAVVLQYFDLCSKFWNSEDAQAQLASWSALVEQGIVPDFGGNLDY